MQIVQQNHLLLTQAIKNAHEINDLRADLASVAVENERLRTENDQLKRHIRALEREVVDLADTIVNLTLIIEPGSVS
jgi:regulator of replication initiation timing